MYPARVRVGLRTEFPRMWTQRDVRSAATTFYEKLVNRTNVPLGKGRLVFWEWEVGRDGLHLWFDNNENIRVPIQWIDKDGDRVRGLTRKERIQFEQYLNRLLPDPDPRDWYPLHSE